jgi:uncharacterized membrane protein YdjX (TVP38/TMEM64 family)
VAKIALGLAGLAVLAVVGQKLVAEFPRFEGWVRSLGVLGPLVFIAVYALAVVAFAPGSALTVAAGVIFGVAQGTLYVFVAATLGASAAFLVARYLARGAVERRLAGNKRFTAIDRAVGEQGRKIVFLLRLSPVFPFNLLNYALGLTRVRFVDYFVACAGMLPGTLLFVYSGSLVRNAAVAAGSGGQGAALKDLVPWIVGLAIAILVVRIVTRTARRYLDEATGEAE